MAFKDHLNPRNSFVVIGIIIAIVAGIYITPKIKNSASKSNLTQNAVIPPGGILRSSPNSSSSLPVTNQPGGDTSVKVVATPAPSATQQNPAPQPAPPTPARQTPPVLRPSTPKVLQPLASPPPVTPKPVYKPAPRPTPKPIPKQVYKPASKPAMVTPKPQVLGATTMAQSSASRVYKIDQLNFQITMPASWQLTSEEKNTNVLIFTEQSNGGLRGIIEVLVGVQQSLESLAYQLHADPTVSQLQKITLNGITGVLYNSSIKGLTLAFVSHNNIYYFRGDLAAPQIMRTLQFLK